MARSEITDNRRIYLCTYDVSEDKRRTNFFELPKGHGEHVQSSVFLCSLGHSKVIQLGAVATNIIHQEEDQLLVTDIGPGDVDWTTSLTCHGKT